MTIKGLRREPDGPFLAGAALIEGVGEREILRVSLPSGALLHLPEPAAWQEISYQLPLEGPVDAIEGPPSSRRGKQK